MVKDFKRRGVPIDGVGLQLHISRLDDDRETLASNIARLTALGLQVHITELDVSLPVNSVGRATVEDQLRQASVYRGSAGPPQKSEVHGDPNLGSHR